MKIVEIEVTQFFDLTEEERDNLVTVMEECHVECFESKDENDFSIAAETKYIEADETLSNYVAIELKKEGVYSCFYDNQKEEWRAYRNKLEDMGIISIGNWKTDQ